MVGRHRTIRESGQFELSRDRLRLNARRLDEIIDGVVWALARDAEGGIQPLPGVNVWFKVTLWFPGVPAYRIWYRIVDELMVELLLIDPIEEDEHL